MIHSSFYFFDSAMQCYHEKKARTLSQLPKIKLCLFPQRQRYLLYAEKVFDETYGSSAAQLQMLGPTFQRHKLLSTFYIAMPELSELPGTGRSSDSTLSTHYIYVVMLRRC